MIKCPNCESTQFDNISTEWEALCIQCCTYFDLKLLVRNESQRNKRAKKDVKTGDKTNHSNMKIGDQ